MGLLFTVSLPEIKSGERPRRRFMSAFEQRREVPNRAFQYLVVSSAFAPEDRLTGNWLARGRAVRDDLFRDTVKGDGG